MVADIACGAGYGSFIMGNVAAKVHGFDIDDKAILHAQKYFACDNVEFYNASLLGNDKFDVIVSFETIEHVTEDDGDEFLQSIQKALRPDGLLIISTPICRSDRRINVTPYHLREYNEDEFAAKLAANGFCVNRWYGQCNSYSEALANPIVGKISINMIIKSNVHRIVPKPLRHMIMNHFFGKHLETVNDTIQIVPDDLSRASVQIAICKRN